MSAEDLARRVEALIAEAKAINEELAKLPALELRRHGLWHRYNIAAVCSPLAGAALPIVDERFEHKTLNFTPNVDRAHFREMMRRSRMPEPMIWDRWPPHTAEEVEEERERLTIWHRSRPVPKVGVLLAPPKADPFENFLRLSARREARERKKPMEELLASADFREAKLQEWKEIQAIEESPP